MERRSDDKTDKREVERVQIQILISFLSRSSGKADGFVEEIIARILSVEQLLQFSRNPARSLKSNLAFTCA